ncbi:ECF-type sigma factor [Luteolibacter marinus]|uniref:ECF-type sigma factor n=1 Tax=Luteolibacter marinus TaxID=2776705 RepID=UPI001866A0C1|nr:ECF-type sigma factor [Luteolibacter marinus]
MDDITRVLNAMAAGDPAGSAELLEVVYRELRGMAAAKMAGERPDHTLQPTALVHEAYLRLAGNRGDWQSRLHFYGAASEAMRRILVDHARQRAARKRGGGAAVTALDDKIAAPDPDEKLLRVHEVLDELAHRDPLKADIVKLRIFAGLGHDEIAALLDLNEKTVRRHWEAAKIWLYQAIRGA